MSIYQRASKLVILSSFFLALVACDVDVEPTLSTSEVSSISDAAIKAQIESIIAVNKDEVPQQLSVVVDAGVVTITGSLSCDDCGGLRSPGALGTVQQSLGAVVRAVSGVKRVEFELSSDA